MPRWIQTIAVALSVAAIPMMASAEPLRVALSTEPTAADPHYHELGPNNALAEHTAKNEKRSKNTPFRQRRLID